MELLELCLLCPVGLKRNHQHSSGHFLHYLFVSDDPLFDLGFVVDILKHHENMHFIGLPDSFCAFSQLKLT